MIKPSERHQVLQASSSPVCMCKLQFCLLEGKWSLLLSATSESFPDNGTKINNIPHVWLAQVTLQNSLYLQSWILLQALMKQSLSVPQWGANITASVSMTKEKFTILLPLSANSTGSPFVVQSIQKCLLFPKSLHGLPQDVPQISSPVTLHLQHHLWAIWHQFSL